MAAIIRHFMPHRQAVHRSAIRKMPARWPQLPHLQPIFAENKLIRLELRPGFI
jgi:hypothetical protein